MNAVIVRCQELVQHNEDLKESLSPPNSYLAFVNLPHKTLFVPRLWKGQRTNDVMGGGRKFHNRVYGNNDNDVDAYPRKEAVSHSLAKKGARLGRKEQLELGRMCPRFAMS